MRVQNDTAIFNCFNCSLCNLCKCSIAPSPVVLALFAYVNAGSVSPAWKKLRWPGWPGHWAEPDRIWWSLGAQTEKELWLQTLGVQPHISNLKTTTALKTEKVEISRFEVTVTWMDEIFDSKRIQAMRIHITSYHYEPFKGPDGLLSPRMVSSSAFHLRPDCQCLTEKTTPHGFCRWSFLSHGHQVWGFNSKLKIFLNFSEGFCIFFLFSWQRANRLT